MTLGLCYWILMLIWLVWGALTHLGYGAGYGVVNVVLLFILFLAWLAGVWGTASPRRVT